MPRLHAAARGSATLESVLAGLDLEAASALDVCSFAVPYLTTLAVGAARIERALVGAGDGSALRTDDPAAEFATQVALADLALHAHARSQGVDRQAHREQVTLAAQAEVQLLAERVEEGHERGFVTAPVTMLAESLARALRCAEHDCGAFRAAAVDWGASALALYVLSTLSAAVR